MHMGLATPPAFSCQVRDSFELDGNIGALTLSQVELSACRTKLRPALDRERILAVDQVEPRISVTNEVIIPKRIRRWPSCLALSVAKVDPSRHRLIGHPIKNGESDFASLEQRQGQ